MGENKYFGRSWQQFGSIIYGCLGVAGSLYFLINESIVLSTLDNRAITPDNDPKSKDENFIVLRMIAMTSSRAAGTMTLSIITLVLSVMLIYGTIQRNLKFIFPFMCVSFAVNLASVPILVSMSVYVFNTADTFVISNFRIILIGFSAIQLICTSLWRVVYNFYQELIHNNYGGYVDDRVLFDDMLPFVRT